MEQWYLVDKQKPRRRTNRGVSSSRSARMSYFDDIRNGFVGDTSDECAKSIFDAINQNWNLVERKEDVTFASSFIQVASLSLLSVLKSALMSCLYLTST